MVQSIYKYFAPKYKIKFDQFHILLVFDVTKEGVMTLLDCKFLEALDIRLGNTPWKF